MSKLSVLIQYSLFTPYVLNINLSPFEKEKKTLKLLHLGLPGPCKEIVASEITKSSCKVSWDPPDFDGGSPIMHYVLQVSFLFGLL